MQASLDGGSLGDEREQEKERRKEGREGARIEERV